MLDREAAIKILKSDSVIRNLVQLAKYLGADVSERNILGILKEFEDEATRVNKVEPEPEETYYFLLRSVVFILVNKLNYLLDHSKELATVIAYEILDDALAFEQSEKLQKYVDKDVYKWAIKRGMKYIR